MAKAPRKNPTKPASRLAKVEPEKFSGQLKPGFITSPEELFVSDIKDLLWAENHLVKAIPKLIAAAGAADLKDALTEHLEITKEHAARLEQALSLLGENVVAKKCDAMEGLTISGEQIIENTLAGTDTRDTGIVMSGLKVENFEITCYTGLISTANKLGKEDIASLLQPSLDEEIAAADTLSGILAA